MPRHAVLALILRLVLHHRRAIYGGWLALSLGAIACLAVFGLRVDTGRQNMASEDDPDARRFQRFAELFGTTLNAVVVIEGADERANEEYADQLADALRADPLVGSVFYRISAEDFRRFALLYASPEQLSELAEGLRDLAALGGSSKDTIRVEGLAGALSRLNELAAKLEDGDTEGFGALGKADVDVQAANSAVTRAFSGLRDALTGEPINELQWLRAAGVQELEAAGIDGRGYLTANDGELVFLFAQPSGGDEQAETLTAFVDALEAHATRLAPAGVSYGVTGYPAHIATETRLVVHDVWMTSIAALIGVILLFALLYGSAAKTAFMLVPLGAGVLVTLGFVSAITGEINLLSSSFFAFLVGLGVDFGIHIITRFDESLRGGASPEQAAEDAVLKTGPGVVTGALTTVAAFLALLASDFSGQRELGVLAAGGLIWVLSAALTLGPALLVTYSRHRDGADRDASPVRIPAGVSRWLSRLIHRPGIVLGSAAIVTAVLAPGIRPLEFSFDVSQLLPADAPAVTAYETLRKNDVFSPDFAVIIADSEQKAREVTRQLQQRADLVARVESAATYIAPDQEAKLPLMKEVQDAVRALPTLQWVAPDSALDSGGPKRLIAELNKLADALELDFPLTLKMYGKDALLPVVSLAAKEVRATVEALQSAPEDVVRARLAELDSKLAAAAQDTVAYLDRERLDMTPADLPQTIRDSYWRQDAAGEHYAIRVYPKGDIADPVFMDQFRGFVSQIDPDVTGLPITFLAWGKLFREGMERAALLALFIVALLVWLDFRRVSDAALALFPLAIGTLWMIGGMNMAGIGYNFANVIALPLILGIGMDSGVHVLHRYREGTRPDALPTTTGKAIGASSLTTLLAFGSLAAARHRGLESLGMTLVLGVVGCLVSATIVLPALLQWLDDRRARTGGRST